jgi:hypothetical protein
MADIYLITDQLGVANRALVRLGATKISSLDEDSDRARACASEISESRQETLRAHPWNFSRKRARINAFPQANLAPGTGANVASTLGVAFSATAPVFLTDGSDVGARILGNGGTARITSVIDSQNVLADIDSAFQDLTVLGTNTWRVTVGWQWDFRYPKPAGYLRLVTAEGISFRGSGTSILWSWWRDLNNNPEPVKVEDQFLVSNVGGKLDIAYSADVPDVTRWDTLAKSAWSALLAFRICYAVTGSLQASKTQHDAYKADLAEARTMNGQEGSADDSGSDILIAVRQM